MCELSAATALAGSSFGHHVVSGAEQLEIVQVIKNRYALRFELPKNRRGQVMIDVAHMRDVGTESGDDLPQPSASVNGIDNVSREFGACYPSMGRPLEIDVRHEVLVVGGGLATRIRHRKERDFVALSSHQLHELKHVNLSTTKRKIVFIAIENSHRKDAP